MPQPHEKKDKTNVEIREAWKPEGPCQVVSIGDIDGTYDIKFRGRYEIFARTPKGEFKIIVN